MHQLYVGTKGKVIGGATQLRKASQSAIWLF